MALEVDILGMLSIIIPTLNEENYLPILLSEIEGQDFNEKEVIVADADSKDKTVEIAKSFSCNIIKGGLPAKGRNEGARIAMGEMLLFMDADNFHLPENFLKDLIGEFKKRKLDVASFPVCPEGNWLDSFAYGLYNLWSRLSQGFLAHATNSILVKKEVHWKINGFDQTLKFAEDHDYVRRASKISRFGFIETKSVLTSPRRFERDGKLKTYLKYILAGIWMLFLGPIRSDIFHYRYGYDFLTKLKEKIKYSHIYGR